MNHLKLIIISVIFISLYSNVNGIRCYVCRNCTSRPAKAVKCPHDDLYCAYYEINTPQTNNETRKSWACVSEPFCHTFRNSSVACMQCKSNKCNNNNHGIELNVSNFVIMMSLAVIGTVYQRLR
uniref:CSON004375 protein n=1 Tax=Culicoides sonorensis TaxID=179676 RepID=A0A336MTD7_CULSO